jgi:membrane fusion protein (multidrug efflux system)
MRRQESAALVVPEAALLQLQGTYQAAVVGADNKVSVRRIEVGPATGGMRVVTNGLREGERIVLDGVQKVTDGALVNPQPASKTPLVSGTR